jgi:hypothetical protein
MIGLPGRRLKRPAWPHESDQGAGGRRDGENSGRVTVSDSASRGTVHKGLSINRFSCAAMTGVGARIPRCGSAALCDAVASGSVGLDLGRTRDFPGKFSETNVLFAAAETANRGGLPAIDFNQSSYA